MAFDGGDRVRVSLEAVYLGLGAHVPHASDRVAAGAHQHVHGGMQSERIAGAQMAVVVTYDLVGLQVPALDLFVLAAREQVRMARTDAHAAHRAHVACQRQFQSARGQIPNLVFSRMSN